MEKRELFQEEKIQTARGACGRSFDEQIASIEKYGNHGATPVLRNVVLAAHGIANPKAKAAYGIIFGCYRPFTTPFLLRDYIRLLDLLDIDYTWLDREYCCGWPLMVEQPENAGQVSEGFNRKNIELAGQKGADTLAYCCIGCAYAAKYFIKEAPEQHIYVLDLIIDAMEKRKNKTKPIVVGYFEGCHAFPESCFPNVEINWKRYRHFLGSIEGLTIVDLPNTLCCKRAMSKIKERATELKLDKVVCPCNACYRELKAGFGDDIQVLTVPEILLPCFDK